jgi:hypothetical protein
MKRTNSGVDNCISLVYLYFLNKEDLKDNEIHLKLQIIYGYRLVKVHYSIISSNFLTGYNYCLQ